ncbi:peptidoglycan DD-metalloendopeptidase family protein [Candidatus Dojkabacteria bacterium]|nr:peptidoglycan DD-metalloendopeptidase family protein [Candidatus Dojkabacteria bacterium]
MLFTSYGGIFLSSAKLNPVEAYSTLDYPDCGELSPDFGDNICYIRGTYEPWVEWSEAASCWTTNRIVYPGGYYYRFCDNVNTAALTNHEVIAWVHWHTSWFSILEVADFAENYNQPPNQPSMIRPQSLWEMGPRNNAAYSGVTCNTSGTGQGCSVDFVTRSFDPDFYQWIRLESQVRKNEGGNLDYNQTLNSNDQTYTRNRTLSDGHWTWRARNCDTTDECSTYTGWRSFVVDTTAPTGVSMNSEPEFTAGTQNGVNSTAGSDNLIGGIQYNFQMDDDPAFGSPDGSSGWVDTNSYTFASLTDDVEYYYRVRARDRLYNTGGWSSSVSSTQDSVFPLVSGVSVTNERISPQNQDGQFDDSVVDFDWQEKYPDNTRLEVLDSGSNVVRTITDVLPAGSETPVSHQFVWDGRDNSSAFVPDGPYTLRLSVTDKAGNEEVDDSNVVIVDNIPADINISTPVSGSWFNDSDITINGQTEADAVASITNNQSSVQTALTLDGLGLFSYDDTLLLGANTFTFDVTDYVHNTNQVVVSYYQERSAPSIDSVSPDDLNNNRKPEVTVSLSDTGYDDGSNEYISGIDSDSLFISLTHPVNGELVLANDGVNTQPSLGNIQQTCDGPGNYGNSGAPSCTYKFVFTSDLTPDGDYTITTRASDVAGTSAIDSTEYFELDSNIQSDLVSPSEGNLFNYSKIQLTGTAEKNSQIDLSLPLGDLDGDGLVDSETFDVSDSVSNPSRVEVTSCHASGSPETDGIKEICDWSVVDFQLERDTVTPGNVTNQIQVDTKDNADVYPSTGLNTSSQSISVNVDLFAVTLSLNTDIEYFSPNGDGNQDGVNFTDISTNGQIDTYELEIKDSDGNVVRSFTAGGTPPNSIPWDGRDTGGNFVGDGTYTYQLKVLTTDGINFETTPASLYAATELSDSVVITYPKNDSYSSRGVINVQGQAPLSLVSTNTGTDSMLEVKICVDTMAISGECDTEYYTTVDDNGFFSTIVMLPRVNSQDEHYITATALDKYGNETPPSNQVKVTTTSNPPFENVEIIPALTGTNDPAAYQAILDKLDNGEDITQADIDALRYVIMRSTVYQGTERVRLSFADHSMVDVLPSSTDWNNIGYITGDNVTKLYKIFVDGTTPYTACNSTTCTWDFYYPLPSSLQGLYEVKFEGKLDVEVQSLTAGFTVDGNIPLTPIILDIDKVVGGIVSNTNYYNDIFYSNSKLIQIKGASDPGALIEVKDNSGNTICSTTASAVGIWNCNVDVSTVPDYSSPDTSVYTIPLDVFATLGLNTSQSIDPKTVVIDKIDPQIDQVNTSNQWRRSGSVVDLNVLANESLSYAISIDKQEASDPDQCINSSATYEIYGSNLRSSDRGDLPFWETSRSKKFLQGFLASPLPIQTGAIDDLIVASDDLSQANGSFVLSGNAVEGRYCTTVEVSDLAGNSVREGQVFFVDNTSPNTPNIDTSDWGNYNGINTKPGYIAEGRLVPEFVHEENQIKVKGWSEENTNMEFYVDAKLVSTTDLVTGECAQSLASDKIADTVNVQDKDVCAYSFNYPLTKNGKDYVFQIKSVDRAGNKSIISEDEVVYYDNKRPINPEVIRTKSVSYDPTPEWRMGNQASVTKDLSINLVTHAESLSDLEFTAFGPQSFSRYIFTQTPGNQVKDQNVPLGSSSDERSGCVNMIGTRRTGVCQDGNYTVQIISTDAAGNASGLTKHTIERDTVRPEEPVIYLDKRGAIGEEYLTLSVKGEAGATAEIHVSSRYYSRVLNANLDNHGRYSTSNLIGRITCGDVLYTATVKVVDRAKNKSDSVSDSVRSGDCPACYTPGGEYSHPVHSDKVVLTSGYRTASRPDHGGVDFALLGGPEVSWREPIYPMAPGTATKVKQQGGVKGGSPNYVDVTHDNGIVSTYWHLDNDSPSVVGLGERLDNVGEKLGHMGNTGNVWSSLSGDKAGTHLHFGVYVNGKDVNPGAYIGGGSNVVCDGVPSSGGKPASATAPSGNYKDKWAGKDGNSLGKPWVNLEVTKKEGGDFDIKVKDYYIPAPEITYVTTKYNGSKAVLNGVAVYKHRKADFEVKYKSFFGKSCFIFCSNVYTDEETIKFEDELDHVGLNFREDRPWKKDQDVGWIWNDSSDGRWEKDLELDNKDKHDLNVGDKIFTQTKIWDTTKFHTNADGDVEISFTSGDEPLISDRSNTVEIKEDKKGNIGDKYGIDLVDGAGSWTDKELEWINSLLGSLPSNLYDHGHVNEFVREASHASAAASYDYTGTKNVYVYDGAMNFSGFTRYGNINQEEGYKIVITHELAHSYEEYDKASNSAKLLSEFSKISWIENMSVIYESWAIDSKAKPTTVDYTSKSITLEDFVTDYASSYSYEDWAESVAVFQFKKGTFSGGTQKLEDKEKIVDKKF